MGDETLVDGYSVRCFFVFFATGSLGRGLLGDDRTCSFSVLRLLAYSFVLSEA
jgi:hypothetical protein